MRPALEVRESKGEKERSARGHKKRRTAPWSGEEREARENRVPHSNLEEVGRLFRTGKVAHQSRCVKGGSKCDVAKRTGWDSGGCRENGHVGATLWCHTK